MKDMRTDIYGENVVTIIEKFIETKKIECIIRMYNDPEVKKKLIKFSEDSINKESIKNFDRIYPMYDYKSQKFYFRYWPTLQESIKKIKEYTEGEKEGILEVFKVLQENIE